MPAGNRRHARELALKVLFALRDQEPDAGRLLEDFWSCFRFADDELGETLDSAGSPVSPPVRSFADQLVTGVVENLAEIDRTIARASTNWALERMARVDLALLRLATYELLFLPATPTSVVLNEAIEIGKRYGTRETPAFVNGILDRIARSDRPVPPVDA